MKNMIKLYSLKIDLEKFLNLTNDSKFESYKKYEVYANKDIKVNTFYLLDKVDGNQVFYLDQKNNLKRMKINVKPEDLNSQEYFYLDKIKSNNSYQIILDESKLRLIKSNNLFDIREDILFPILIEHFNISKPTFFDNKIIWEKVEDKEIEFLNIFKDKNLTNEDKLEKFSELLEISRSQMSIH